MIPSVLLISTVMRFLQEWLVIFFSFVNQGFCYTGMVKLVHIKKTQEKIVTLGWNLYAPW
jgi:hypothetical protein